MKLLIGSAQYVNAVNEDIQIEIGLNNQTKLFDEDVITEIIDESIQFNLERQNCTNYLLYGKIENLIDDSLSGATGNFDIYNLNDTNYNISLGYVYAYQVDNDYLYPIISATGNNLTVTQNNVFLKDDAIVLYYNPTTLFVRKVIDSAVNLVTLDDIPTGITVTNFFLVPSVAPYARIFQPLYTSDYLKFYNSAFSVNPFNNPIFQFNSFRNINLSGLTDVFGLPVTEIFFNFSLNNTVLTNNYNSDGDVENNLNIIDIIQYDLNNILQTNVDTTYYTFTNNIGYIYYPWVSLPYQVFSQQVVNTTTGTSFDYPDYSFVFSDGDVLYKDLLQLGYFENSTNGVNYPFMNNLQYLYTDIKFIIRRQIPIFNYTNPVLLDTSNIIYNTNLITPTVGSARLC